MYKRGRKYSYVPQHKIKDVLQAFCYRQITKRHLAFIYCTLP